MYKCHLHVSLVQMSVFEQPLSFFGNISKTFLFFKLLCISENIDFSSVLRTANSGARARRSVRHRAGKTGARDHNNRRNFPTSHSLLLRRIVTELRRSGRRRNAIIPVRTPDITAILPFVFRHRRHSSSSSSSFAIVVAIYVAHTMVL